MVSGEYKHTNLQNKCQLAADIHITAITGKENNYVNIAFFSEIVFSCRSCYKRKKNCSLYFLKLQVSPIKCAKNKKVKKKKIIKI